MKNNGRRQKNQIQTIQEMDKEMTEETPAKKGKNLEEEIPSKQNQSFLDNWHPLDISYKKKYSRRELLNSKQIVSIVICLEIFILCLIEFSTFVVNKIDPILYKYLYRSLSMNLIVLFVGITCMFKFVKFKSCSASKVAGLGLIIISIFNMIAPLIRSINHEIADMIYHGSSYMVILLVVSFVAAYAAITMLNKRADDT